MDFLKIIRFFYTVYTVYIILVINTTSLKFMDILPAVLLMWILYFFFSLGYRLTKVTSINVTLTAGYKSWILNKKKLDLFTIAILSITFSILAANYYTGQTPFSIINTLFSNEASLYYEYQKHAQLQLIAEFSVRKTPFILMMFFVKIILFYSYISFLIVKEKSTYFDKFYLLLITFAHIYFGVARGTNYELFELMILFVFVILYKSKRVRSIKIPLKNVLIVSLVGIIMIYLFYNRIADRGVVFDFSKSRDFIYDPEGVIATIFPLLSYITLLVYDYFGFGFYYLSIYISHVWFQSIGNFFAGLFPFGYTFIENSKIQEIMPNYVEMGPRWHPDTAILINNLGFIGLLILGTILGSCAKFTFREGNNSSLTYLTQFIILLQIISLPIGNFVFISSASTLIVMLISFIWFWKIFIKVKIKL